MEENEELRLEDAKWFAKEMGTFTRKQQAMVFAAKNDEQLRQVYGGDAGRLRRGLDAWKIESSLGNHIDIPSPRTTHVEKAENLKSESVTSPVKVTAGTGAVGAFFVADRIKNWEYNNFKKDREKFVKEQVEKWKENPDEAIAKSEEGARNRAINEFNDKKLAEVPKKFEKWAKKHKDPDLERAIKRKEILEKENPRRNKKELDKFLEDREIKNPDKTHRSTSDISQEEANQRLEKASAIGIAKLATPAATATYLESLNKPAEDAHYDELPAESAQAIPDTSTGINEKVEEVVKEIEHQQEIERKESGGVTSYTKPIPQQPAQGSAFNNPQSIFRTPRIYRRAQRVRRRYGPGGVSKGVGKKAAKKGAMWLGRAALSNPYVVGVILFIIGFLFALFVIVAFIQDTCDKFSDPIRFAQESFNDPGGMLLRTPIWGLLVAANLCPNNSLPYEVDFPKNPPGVNTEKTGPLTADNGESLTYIITVTYDPGEANAISYEEYKNMSLFDVPAFNHQLVSTTGVRTPITDPEADTYYQYEFANNPTCLEGDFTCQFVLTITPSGTDFWAINTIYVAEEYVPVSVTFNTDALGSNTGGGAVSGDLTEGRNSPPSNRSCGGQWNPTLNKPNFGDPVCSYTPENFTAYLKEVAGPRDWEFFEAISIAEGSDDRPGGNLNRGSASGWGTFQMGPKSDTMHTWHGPGSWSFRYPWDHGDVPWQRQIEFAVARNDYWRKNVSNGNFAYWGTAYCLCYFDYYRSKNNWCNDIRDSHDVRCPEKCFGGSAYCTAQTDQLGRQHGDASCSAHACYTGIGDSRVEHNVGQGW